MRRTRVPGFVLLGMGIFWIAITFIVMLSFNFEASKCDMKVQGIVVELDEHVSDGTRMYTPTIEYCVDGESYMLYSNTSSSTWRGILGKEMTVLYNSDDPSFSCLEPPSFLSIIQYVFYCIGGLFLVFGVFISVFGVKIKLTPDEMYDRRY